MIRFPVRFEVIGKNGLGLPNGFKGEVFIEREDLEEYMRSLYSIRLENPEVRLSTLSGPRLVLVINQEIDVEEGVLRGVACWKASQIYKEVRAIQEDNGDDTFEVQMIS